MRLVRVAAAAAVGVAVLAGCSAGATANETLPSTSATAAETTESLPPLGPPDLLMPDEAREMTPAGAEAFLHYYMDVYNAAQRTMNNQYLRQFSQGCATCDRISGEIEGDAAAGYHYEGGEVTVDSLSPAAIKGTEAELAFGISQRTLSVVGTDGTPVPGLSFPERTKPACGSFLTWNQSTSSWAITQWDIG